MPEFKPAHLMSLEEYISEFLPKDHNDQDLKYLNARWNWETGKTIEERSAAIEIATKEYWGTTFQMKNYPGIEKSKN